MEGSKVEKRVILDDSDEGLLQPTLVRINKQSCAPPNIHIDKNEFRIGRARDNDEIILNAIISRKHCIIRREGNKEWIIKDISSSGTFVNDVPLISGVSRKLNNGDIVRFGTSEEFKYLFILGTEDEHKIKKAKLDEQILDNVLIEQKTFAESQECLKKIVKDKLQIKQKEQDNLKQQLEQLLKQQGITNENTEDLKRQITVLKKKLEHGNVQEKYIKHMYAELLEKLENKRNEFERKLNEEKQKWQEALNISKLEKEMLEIKMKEQMEKWREDQQAEWKNMMENKVKEEKSIQAQLVNEKTLLEEKLKETEKALKEQEAKVRAVQNNVAGTSENSSDGCCIFIEIADDPSHYQIIDTIDITDTTQPIIDTEKKESVVNKVNDIMDEQLTCSICSELFVKATTLNCMHTFCNHCIHLWNKKKQECPICRTPISTMNRPLALDNFIESMIENLSIKFKERRKEIIKERQ
ncbi:unnamed protein product, partial [Heterotrigona itama]